MGVVDLPDQSKRLPVIDVVQAHHPLHAKLQRCSDKDGHMGDGIAGEDAVRTATHDHKISFFCQITEKIALVEKEGVSGIQTMIAVGPFHPLRETLMLLGAVGLHQKIQTLFIHIGVIGDVILGGFQALHDG